MRWRRAGMSGRAKLGAAGAAVIVAAIPATVVAGSLGGSDRPGQARLAGVATARLHLVGARAPGARAQRAKSSGSRGVSLAYLETARQTVPTGRSSLRVGPTPRHCRAINGYYFIPSERRTEVVSEGDSLAGYRHWTFYRLNQSGAPVSNVVYGVVCIRGAKLIG
jgi:hypothetical protein